MNNQRRRELDKAATLVGEAREALEEALAIVESVAGDERGSFDNLSEGLQQTEQGMASEAAADALDEAQAMLADFDADDILGKIEEACG